jgi:hypothetical protein
MVTEVPIGPELGEIVSITGGGTTVNIIPLLALPLTFTTMLPVVAPAGIITVINVALQLSTVVTGVPLKVTVLEP